MRVKSWVQRFINNTQRPQNQRELGELTAAELQTTEEKIINETQRNAFEDEIRALENNQPLPRRSSLLPLTPVMIKGTLRSNTRLRYSTDLPAEVKFPVILPKKNHVTKLIDKFYHESEGHRMGVNLTNRFHFAVRLYSDNAQMTSKRGENKEVRYEPQASSVTDVLTTF